MSPRGKPIVAGEAPRFYTADLGDGKLTTFKITRWPLTAEEKAKVLDYANSYPYHYKGLGLNFVVYRDENGDVVNQYGRQREEKVNV